MQFNSTNIHEWLLLGVRFLLSNCGQVHLDGSEALWDDMRFRFLPVQYIEAEPNVHQFLSVSADEDKERDL